MTNRPTITTERLLLRPMKESDAEVVRRLAGDVEIAGNTNDIPHPYPPAVAEEWIATHEKMFNSGREVVFAVVLRDSGELVGTIGLVRIAPEHERGEIGYWIGRRFWGRGYCTEAALAVIAWGFTEYRLHRIFGQHFLRNPASGRVMEKSGMRCEGVLRGHEKKWGVFEDVAVWGICKDDCSIP